MYVCMYVRTYVRMYVSMYAFVYLFYSCMYFAGFLQLGCSCYLVNNISKAFHSKTFMIISVPRPVLFSYMQRSSKFYTLLSWTVPCFFVIPRFFYFFFFSTHLDRSQVCVVQSERRDRPACSRNRAWCSATGYIFPGHTWDKRCPTLLRQIDQTVAISHEAYNTLDHNHYYRSDYFSKVWYCFNGVLRCIAKYAQRHVCIMPW